MRSAESKGKDRSMETVEGLEAGPVHSAFRTPHSAFLSLAQRQDVRKEPIGAGDTGGQLSEKAQPRVDVRALSYPRHEQAPREPRLPPVVRLQRGDKSRNPVGGEVQPPPLHPSPPVGPGDLG